MCILQPEKPLLKKWKKKREEKNKLNTVRSNSHEPEIADSELPEEKHQSNTIISPSTDTTPQSIEKQNTACTSLHENIESKLSDWLQKLYLNGEERKVSFEPEVETEPMEYIRFKEKLSKPKETK